MSISEKLSREAREEPLDHEHGTSLEVTATTWSEQFQFLWECKRAAFACLACSSAAVLIGYDMTLIGSIIANVEFVKKFGKYDADTDSWTLPADEQLVWSVVQYVSAMCGAMGAGYMNDMIGRRAVFHILVACTMVGTMVELFSPDWKVWIVAKLLFGAAMGFMQGTIPAYISELAPSRVRGFLLSLFQFWIMFGAFIAACVLEGTFHVDGPWSWKGTIVSQFGLGILCLVLFIPLVPESPYYLASKGRLDAAKASLLTMRGSEANYIVDEDLATIVGLIEHERLGKDASPSYLECFQGPNLRRTFLACLPMVMQHFLGYPLCGNYLAYFLTMSGMNNGFTITVISMTVSMLAIICAFVLIEKVGRRLQYLVGTFAILPCLLCIGILGFVPSSTAVLRGVASLCIIWSFLWYLSVGAVGWTIVGEISSPRLRPKTTSLAATINSLINMGWSIAIPYLVNSEKANLGPKTGLVFFGPSVVLAGVAYFAMPETKGKTFEELDALFESRTPARKF
ncbi:hypothetical protein BHE90_013536 [Fusarium euwallaceae]|uniref:Major facilitator superfamily (MFS) profile domain-containing protein n=1 Tax=Fusarium euwallaceae TaxID=1147111 RepID=A0A430L8L4_9HYPO|nr:hypothetical protein BHE90_013536 [Fusarium euwallaceae]